MLELKESDELLELMPIPNLECVHSAELRNLQRLFTGVGPNGEGTTLVGYKGRCYHVTLSRQDLYEGSVYYTTILDVPTRKFRRMLCCAAHHEYDLMNRANEMLGLIQSLDMDSIEYYN